MFRRMELPDHYCSEVIVSKGRNLKDLTRGQRRPNRVFPDLNPSMWSFVGGRWVLYISLLQVPRIGQIRSHPFHDLDLSARGYS